MERITLLSLLALACAQSPALPQGTQFGALRFSPCTIGSLGASASAQCAQLSVPENRADPTSRRISLAVAWLPARAKAASDPVFLIAGGPGLAARDTYAGFAFVLPELHEHHDVILVDQRGIGGSSPLNCLRSEMNDDSDESPEAGKARLLECADTLSKTADVRFYSTTEATLDLDEVRHALGVDQINLYGASYGTRVVQQYAKRFARHTRTITLDGVAPNSLVLVGHFAADLDEAIEKQLAVCSSEPACAALGDPRERLANLLAQLNAAPMPVRYRDAATGEITSGLLRRSEVVELVRGWAYRPSSLALLPLLLKEASEGRLELLAALAKRRHRGAESEPSTVAPYSVLCTEDASELTETHPRPSSLLGDSVVRRLKAACDGWPHGERPADFREPLTGSVPALLLSGALDPVTPPRYAEAVRASLPNARHLVVPGQGHQVITVGCVPKVVAQFVETANALSLDASCLDSISLSMPFTGFYGWSP